MPFIQSLNILHLFLVFMGLCLSAFSYYFLAKKLNIVDIPNSRSSHSKPIIRGGGVLFVIAMLWFFIESKFGSPYFFSGLIILAIVSFIDDLKTLSTKIRLAFQFLAIFLLIYELGLIDLHFLLIGILLVIGVGFINLFNFMDGINGITGIYGMTVILGFLRLNWLEGDLDSRLMIYVLLSIVVFGIYNFRKKTLMFAGDVGSMSLAYLILFLGFYFCFKLTAPVILLMILVYGLDASLTIFYRMYLRENITEGHRHHLYQKFVDVYKWSHLKVSVIYSLTQLLVFSVVFLTYKYPFVEQVYIILIAFVLGGLGYIFLFRKFERAKETNLNRNDS